MHGSATDPEREPRDLDVAVWTRDGTALDLLGLVGDLIQLTHDDDVDVMVLNRADPLARMLALRDPLVLLERPSGLRLDLLVTAELMFADTAWLRQEQLEGLREARHE